MLRQKILLPVLVSLAGLYASGVSAYPLDGYPQTGIRRLEEVRQIVEGKRQGKPLPGGATLTSAQVDLRLTDQNHDLPPVDAEFSKKIRALIGGRKDYSIAVLDLSNPAAPRYAEHHADTARNPGSVGKLVVALAVFQSLADIYPQDIEKRISILKNTRIIADEFVNSDHHTVRFFDVDKGTLSRRQLRPGDAGSLWEYLDWMISASSNSAGSVVMKEMLLLNHFRERYPVSTAEATAFINNTPRAEMTALLQKSLQEPLTRNGLDVESLRQGNFFTHVGSSRISGGTNSTATPRELVNYLLKMEQGRLVDAFSSREIKRLMYQTEKRIRYISAPALKDSAVYFKSGSLFRCHAKPCPQYRGDKENLMNSVAIIETPAGTLGYYYLVALMTNVLGKNSASEHAALAARIHKLIVEGK